MKSKIWKREKRRQKLHFIIRNSHTHKKRTETRGLFLHFMLYLAVLSVVTSDIQMAFLFFFDFVDKAAVWSNKINE